MGLSDRDYMSRREESSVFRPPRQSVSSDMTSIMKMILFWVGIIFLLFKALQLFGIKLPIESKLPGQLAPEVAAPPTPASPTSQEPGGITIPDSGQSTKDASEPGPGGTTHTVTKCTHNGTVTFTDATCAYGATTTTVTVTTSNVGTVAPQAPVMVAPAQIVHSPVTQQGSVVVNQIPGQNQVAGNQLECSSLELEIKQIDTLAKQALSGQAQDNLAERRKQVRSRQFALRC